MDKTVINEVIKFRDERNWKQFHNPKDLAISINLEASELLELFQWSGNDISVNGKLDRIKEELADVMNYCILMADICELDIGQIILEKIEKNKKKYPVNLAYGSKAKYTELKERDEKC